MASIRKDIEQLRQSANISGDSSESVAMLRVLIDLTARRDALFWPSRTPVKGAVEALGNLPAIIERREAYLAMSEGIRVKAMGASEWKSMHYLRRQMLSAGWVTAARTKSVITSLFITELGDAVASASIWGATGVPFRSAVAREILSRRESLSESKLFGQELHGDPDEWNHLTELILPLLYRGLVGASQDTLGRVFYRYLPGKLPEPIEVPFQQVEWASEAYYMAFNDELRSLDAIEYNGTEIYIPMPATSAGNCFCSPDVGKEYAPGELESLLSANGDK